MKRLLLVVLVSVAWGADLREKTLLDEGYKQMYNLDFVAAHRTFATWEKQHPEDPMGPVSAAAAFLFEEFERLKILDSELFVEDRSFFSFKKPQVDTKVKQNFDAALERGEKVAKANLAVHKLEETSMMALVLRSGLRANYLAMLERKNLAALEEVKESRKLAEDLLKKHPDCHDGHFAQGIENYLLSQKSAPMRWVLRTAGAQTDKSTGLAQLTWVADKGRYLAAYSRLLMAVAALRDKSRGEAKRLLEMLAREYPQNRLYRQELKKLQ